MKKFSVRQVAVVLSLNLERLIGMKKTLLRTLSALFALCRLCALAAPVSAASFPDVDGLSTQYRDAINYVSDNGIIGGTAEGYFEPNTAITRAMAVTILYRMSGDTGTYTEASQFSDVSASAYYYNAVGWGVSTGFVTGYTEGYFAPNNPVIFQDFCVFLYRYANKYGGWLTIDEAISSASDYSNISGYARFPVQWAYSFGLKVRSSSTEAINPKVNVLRKDAALYVHRYRLNVEGIKFGRDNFSFLNNENYFVSGTKGRYCISAEDYSRLYSYAQTVSTSATTALTKALDADWGGSCYGMSVAAALDYAGKIDLNSNFCSGADTIYEIPTLKTPTIGGHLVTKDRYYTSTTISQVESKINMYQLTQFVFPETTDKWSVPSYVSDNLENLLDELTHGGIGVFSFSDSSNPQSGHVVIAYGKPVSMSSCSKVPGCSYHVNLYDPNKSSSAVLHICEASSGLFDATFTSGGTACILTYCKFENCFDILDEIDIDSDSNVLAASVESSESVFAENSILCVQATGNFTVTNAEGESFRFCDGEVTGSMEVCGFDFIVPGDSVPCELRFLVAPSGSYTCTVDDGAQLLSFYVADSENYLGGTAGEADCWEAATISTAGEAEMIWIGDDES